jgi:Signal transduction histidine kinase
MIRYRLSFLILLLVVFLPKVESAPSRLFFENFPYSDKLPSNSVIRIFNDKEGYIWFGTKDGLCRFDGYEVKVFRSSAFTPGKLTNNEIQCIAEDNNNRIWVGTLEGINIIDKKSYSISSLDNPYLKKERINNLIIDSKGYIWVATSNNGVLCFEPNSEHYIRYSTDADSPLKLKYNSVSQIFEDRAGRIWLSTWKGGACWIDKSRKKISFAPQIGASNNPFRIMQDKSGLYWVCTWGDGIFNMTVDAANRISIRPLPVSAQSQRKVDGIVYSIVQDDKYGYIWAITFNGLILISKDNANSYVVSDADKFFTASSNKLFHEIIKDRKGNLWLGSVGDGLFKLDFNKLVINNYPLSEFISSYNFAPYITRFCELPSGEIYIVANRIGLFQFDLKSGKIKRPANTVAKNMRSISALNYISGTNEIWIANEGDNFIQAFRKNSSGDLDYVRTIPLDKSQLFENSISTLLEDSRGNVWIGSNRGLFLKQGNANVRQISPQIQFVNTICEDKDKNIWVGTEKEGAYVFSTHNAGGKSTYAFTKLNLTVDNYQSLSVQSICCTKNGEIYIGTKEGCIYFYNAKEHTATDISGLYGITEEGIMDILEDDFGMLWITSVKKIIKYNPQTHTATYFSNSDGMLISSFYKDSHLKLKSGQILYGGNNGICALNPASHFNPTHAQKQHVALTDILIQNKSIFDDTDFHHFNARKNRVVLQSDESNLSIEFSALDVASAGKIQYAYMLSGVDKDWTYVGNHRRFVNYANLPTGTYTFLVKACDENGIWSDKVTSLEIKILPPAYKTWWAYLIYLVLLGAAAYFISKTVVNRIRLRNELKISNIEKLKSEELAQIKLRYFTNISHELLTPLTIIMLIIEGMQKRYKSDSAQFNIMKANANRLKRLIQQILIFRKTESGNMKLKIQESDVIAFVNSICQSNFQPLTVEKNIKFSILSDENSYIAYFDPDKMDKILYNLLSNAFKYTPNGGEIAVKMSFIPRMEDVILRLSVSDNGAGIAEEDIPHIFKRFYISSASDQSQSHGIGLALTYDLIQLHKGNIEVKSQLSEGSVFTFEIPVSREAYSDDEIDMEEVSQEAIPAISELSVNDEVILTPEQQEVQENLTILVVEDNRELNTLIVENFRPKYNVLSAENGVQALELLKDNEVNLIISDIMMPEMDGLTFCKLVKNDISTSHINMLMLTAKNSIEDRIECYNAGADAYISKPFELRVLDARAENLINRRKQKNVSFQSNQEINITEMEYGSIDENFLQLAVKAVEDKLSDITFDFDQFAIDMGTSKSTLHRKLKSLTGLSPGEFIRNIRLKHAAKMLVNHVGNISDIAYSVGFNDPKYFSRCFKTEFGLTPKEYIDSHKA